MQIFDQIDPQALESREEHLWFLTLAILFLFAVGYSSSAIPTVFSSPIALIVASPRQTFFGFCAMAAITIFYLADRHYLIS